MRADRDEGQCGQHQREQLRDLHVSAVSEVMRAQRIPHGAVPAAQVASAARTPSMTYCTASAASTTPISRCNTLLPVVPRSFAIGVAATKQRKHAEQTTTMTPSSSAMRIGS